MIFAEMTILILLSSIKSKFQTVINTKSFFKYCDETKKKFFFFKQNETEDIISHVNFPKFESNTNILKFTHFL